MNYTTTRCEAHITLKKGRVKEYGSNRSVHLKDGQEFEIELYNPHQKSVLAKILINGSSIGGGGIVLRPGQRTHLERYLDDNRKFKFNTYTVENSKESVAAIANNGSVEVQFFYEPEPKIYCDYIKWDNLNGWPQNPGWINISNTTGGNPLFGQPINTNYTYDSLTTFNGQNSNSRNYSDQIKSKSFSGGSESSVNCFFSSASLGEPTRGLATPEIETGRVEKGSNSSQSFVTVDIDFNSWWSESVSMKIVPFSQKPIETTEIRNYCATCGTRVKKSSWKFCPSCGGNLEV